MTAAFAILPFTVAVEAGMCDDKVVMWMELQVVEDEENVTTKMLRNLPSPGDL